MDTDSLKKILIIGSGTMGLRIGLQSALSGFDTRIYDKYSRSLDTGRETARKLLERMVSKGRVEARDLEGTWDRMVWSSDLPSLADDIDFVSESITEDLEAKIALWSELGAMVPKQAILTTNTSYLLPSQLAAHSGNPRHFCAFHFHDVFWANVVDIMPHPGTAPHVIDALLDLGKKLNQTPVVVKSEHPGYIFNHMLLAFLGAAGDLLSKEIATIEDIDRSWMGNFKMPIGPFGMLDEVGLDTAWHIIKTKQDSKSQRFATLLKTYLDKGQLGVKTGAGFYSYPQPAFKNHEFVTTSSEDS